MNRLSIDWRRFFPFGPAVLAGTVATPLILLTIERLPLLAPLNIYGALAFFFALLLPRYGWRWGCWVALGIPVATLLAIVLGIAQESGSSSVPFASFVGLMTIFGFIPALLGGLVGAVGGTMLSRLRKGDDKG